MRPLPADARQALRIRRVLLATATSLLMPVILLISAALGLVEYRVAAWSAALMLLLGAGFYAVFRSGLNLRFSDQSLTGEMILLAILSTAVVCYWAGKARPAIEMFYLMALLFGALRLGAGRLLGLAGIALLAHAAMLKLFLANHPGSDPVAALMDLAALVVILPWFAAMGAYVNRLRMRLSDSNRQLRDAYERIEKIAVRDELTGLYNRRFLLGALAREQSRARRLDATFAVCLFDIDHFKSINDTLGHAAGDAVLRHFAQIASPGLRAVDVLGRYGGEEFLLLLPDTDRAGAVAVAERLRNAVEMAAFPQTPAERRVTVTAGIAIGMRDESKEELLARADRALYAGKAAGRNRVVS